MLDINEVVEEYVDVMDKYLKCVKDRNELLDENMEVIKMLAQFIAMFQPGLPLRDNASELLKSIPLRRKDE